MLSNYIAERGGYYKVLIALLLLTTITFCVPYFVPMQLAFTGQMIVATIKAWIILMYYMHLKGEKLIGWTVIFAVLVVVFFFSVVIVDVNNFQFADVSYITSPAK
jgi:caa(3)-type oxidase subunit IV